MVDCIKKYKKILLIVCSVVLLIAILWSLAVYTKMIDVGIDILCRPGDFSGTATVVGSDGYLHLTAERSKYNVQETMVLTLHSAYYDALEDAEEADAVWAGIYHSEYLQIEIADANEVETKKAEFDGIPPVNDLITTGMIAQFDPADLVIQPQGFSLRINRQSLSHSVTLNVKVSEDAPESFEETLLIYLQSDVKEGKFYQGLGSCGVVFVTVVRDGDTVKLYAARDSSLGKVNYL